MGNGLNNTLTGGDGNDTLTGGAGDDALDGGDGETLSLAIMEPAPALRVDKGQFDGGQVLPALADGDLFFSKVDDAPLVLPGPDGFGETLLASLMSMQAALPDPLLVREDVRAESCPTTWADTTTGLCKAAID